MDLIVKLPSTHSQPAFDSILVIVDRLTKFVRLIPCREAMTAGDVVTLFYTHWISLYGLPDQIVSDHGSHFNNPFTEALFTRFRVKHSLSSA
jgi:hypothetical protein